MNYGSQVTGTLTGTTAIVQLPQTPIPATLVLKSSDSGRAIQLSFDNGATYFPAVTPTLTATGEIVYTLPYPPTHVKFTGVANDIYWIL